MNTAALHPARLVYLVNIPRFFVSHRLPLALAAREAGYEVHVATSSSDAENVDHILRAGLPFHPLPISQHGTRPAGELAALRAVNRLYAMLRPQIVHHVTVKAILYGSAAARLNRVPAVVNAVSGLGHVFTAPGTKAALLRAGVQMGYRLALSSPNSRVIFQNPDDCALFVRRRLVSADKTVVIRGSGVDTAVFTALPEPPGEPVVLFAGRLLWQKGVGEFIQAARDLRGAGAAARFVIAGYPEPTSPGAVPAEKLAEWQAAGIVEWWGRRDDMPQVFAQAHIVCLPSSYGEGVPRVLIEAAACGRPLVTTDTPGCREIARHEVNGLLIPSHDPAALCAALRRLIDDGGLRRTLGERGRQIAAAEFSLDHVIAQTLAVYNGLLARQEPAP